MTDLIAWTLLHFLWQGVGIAALVALALHALDEAPAEVRYRVAGGGLLAMALAPLLTALVLAPGASVPAPLPASLGGPSGALGWTAPVTALWILGVALGLGRSGVELVRIERLRRRSIPAPPALQARFRILRRRLGVTARAQLRLIPSGLSPLAVGLVRPAVLLPACLLVRLPPDQIEALLAHELAHVRRLDWVVNLCQAGLETLLFFHPAVHWLSARVRHERELCCDALAARTLADPIGYARALTELHALSAFTLAPAARGGVLMDRIARLLGRRPAPAHRPAWVLPALVLSATIGLVSAAAAVASVPEALDDDGLAGLAPAIEDEDEDDDVVTPEDVGATGLQMLSDELERHAEKLEQRGEERQARRDERRAERDERDARVRVRVGHGHHDETEALAAEIARLEAELAHLRDEARHLQREAHAPRADAGCTELTAPGAHIRICGDDDAVVLSDDWTRAYTDAVRAREFAEARRAEAWEQHAEAWARQADEHARTWEHWAESFDAEWEGWADQLQVLEDGHVVVIPPLPPIPPIPPLPALAPPAPPAAPAPSPAPAPAAPPTRIRR